MPQSRGATAGLRGAYWDPARLPADARLTAHPLRTQDGAVVSGFLMRRGGEKTVVVWAHPREHLVAHYLVPEILLGGCAAWVQAPRLVGNDVRLEHETALFDLAAALEHLRSQERYEKIVVLGNSGGGPLWAFYDQQALSTPASRIAQSPAGRPTKLADAVLPVPDGMIFVSAHLGQGRLLERCIDPSLTDETDGMSIDDGLDPFAPANGFREPPHSASYAPAFVERYRAAQRERVARIDGIARAQAQERAAARRSSANAAAGARAARRAAHTPIFTVWRTDADLRCFDLSLDPSKRPYGSVWGANPLASNYGSIGFARVCTAESWLSTWSGLSSNASMEQCAPAIEQPTLMIEYRGDQSVFPSECDQLFGWIGAADKTRAAFDGDHHGRALVPGEDPKAQAGAAIGAWLRERFPVAAAAG